MSDYIIKWLAQHGVRHIFLLPGGGIMHLVDSVGRSKEVKFTCCLHEQAAAIAADGYAQYTGGLGVCLVTTGPGSTNAITGVYGAYAESTPLLVISGQVKRNDIKQKDGKLRMRGFQEVDIVPMVKSITKYAQTILDPNDVPISLESAFFAATTGRKGPAWLNIPLDVQSATISQPIESATDKSDVTNETWGQIVASSRVPSILSLLKKSCRPIILAGNGVRLSGAEGVFHRVIEKLGIPVLLTWKAADLLQDQHRLNYGRPGNIAQRSANMIQQAADLIISIGARLDYGQTGYATELFAPNAKKVIVDIDHSEIEKHKFTVDQFVLADAGDFLKEVETQTTEYVKLHFEWLQWCAECHRKWHDIPSECCRQDFEPVSTYYLVQQLSRQMTCSDVLVLGSSGACAEIPLQTFQVKDGQRVINSPSIGSMGFGLPQAIGVAMASRRRVILINGDGGFQLNVQELETIRRLSLPIKIFVLNNGGYGSMRTTHKNYFKKVVAADASSGLTLPDPIQLAQTFGINASTISRNNEVSAGISKAFSWEGPFLSNVWIDPNEQTQPRIRNRLRRDGTAEARPPEDMWPLLPRRELKRWMHAS